MSDKQCPSPFAHNAHTWCERENPAKSPFPGVRHEDNPLLWWDCTGIKAAEVYHRVDFTFVNDDGDHGWQCSCGEKGTAAGRETAQQAADAHAAKFKAQPPADLRGGLFSQWRHDYHYLEVIGVDSKDAQIPGERNLVSLGDANLVSSRITSGEHAGKHTVAIDLDVSAVLVPSSTPGHSHLYIDVPMTWETYANLLKALSAAGIVEDGYVQACIRRKHTSLRLPWIRKAPPAPAVTEPSPF